MTSPALMLTPEMMVPDDEAGRETCAEDGKPSDLSPKDAGLKDAALARRIVVAVPTYNEEASIEACLRSLIEGCEAAAFLVSDGRSDDQTRAIVERLAQEMPEVSLAVIDNPARNQSAGVNLAAAAAAEDRDILIRCDAHALYPRGFLIDLARALIETGADSVVVPMDAAHREGAGCFEKANAWIVDTPLGSGGSAHRGGRSSGFVDHGHHAAFWKARYLALGGYDEAMIANQDAEYDTRLRANGGKVWLDASIRLTYFVRPAPARLWKQYWRYGRGRADHVILHRVRPRLRQMIPVAHVGALIAGVGALPLSALPLLGYGGLYGAALMAATALTARKHRSFCTLMVPLVLAIMHTAWGLGFLREVAAPGRPR